MKPDTIIPIPPAPASEQVPVPPTLIQTLNAKLHAAHLDLDAAEQRVKDLEAEIESLPSWAKELTEGELQARIGGWFK